MNSKAVVAIAATGLLLCGCASNLEVTFPHPITITTPPTTGANCVLSTKDALWMVTSPGTVTVAGIKDNISVKCTKEGFQQAVATIRVTGEGRTAGALLVGLALYPGAPNAGRLLLSQRARYPDAFEVPMRPMRGVRPTAAPTARSTAPDS